MGIERKEKCNINMADFLINCRNVLDVEDKNCTIQQTNSEILKTLGREKTVLFLQSVKI